MPRTLEICGEFVTVTDALIQKLPTIAALVADTMEDGEPLHVPEVTVQEFRGVVAHVELGRALKPKHEPAAAFLGLEASTFLQLNPAIVKDLPKHDDWRFLESLKSGYSLDYTESQSTVVSRVYCRFSKRLLWKKIPMADDIRVRLIDIDFDATASFQGMSVALYKRHVQAAKPLVDMSVVEMPVSLNWATFCVERLAEPASSGTIHYKCTTHSFKEAASIRAAGQLRLYLYAESAAGRMLPLDVVPLIRVSHTLQYGNTTPIVVTKGITIEPKFLHDIHGPGSASVITLEPVCRFANVTFHLVIAIPYVNGLSRGDFCAVDLPPYNPPV